MFSGPQGWSRTSASVHNQGRRPQDRQVGIDGGGPVDAVGGEGHPHDVVRILPGRPEHAVEDRQRGGAVGEGVVGVVYLVRRRAGGGHIGDHQAAGRDTIRPGHPEVTVEERQRGPEIGLAGRLPLVPAREIGGCATVDLYHPAPVREGHEKLAAARQQAGRRDRPPGEGPVVPPGARRSTGIRVVDLEVSAGPGGVAVGDIESAQACQGGRAEARPADFIVGVPDPLGLGRVGQPIVVHGIQEPHEEISIEQGHRRRFDGRDADVDPRAPVHAVRGSGDIDGAGGLHVPRHSPCTRPRAWCCRCLPARSRLRRCW